MPDFKEKMSSLFDEYIVKSPWHEIVSRTNDGEFENPEITLVQVLFLIVTDLKMSDGELVTLLSS